MGTSARSAAHRREPDPSSGLATHIGYPAPSCESHRRRADIHPWGRRPISCRRPPRLGPCKPREHDDSLGRRVQRMARRQDQPVVRHALSDPDRGRRDDPRPLDPVGEAPVGHHEHDLVARRGPCRCAGTARRRSCGGRRSRPCRAGRAAACRGSGRARRAGRRRRCPPRRPARRRCGRSAAGRSGRPRRCGGPASGRRTPAAGAGRAASRARAARRPRAGTRSSVAELVLELALLHPVRRRADTGSCHSSVAPASASSSVPETISAVESARSASAPRSPRCGGGAHRRSADSVPPSEPGPA